MNKMKITIDKNDFRQAFRDFGRDNQFSYEGLGALYDYLIEFEESTGEELELDVIALCCEFTEYSSLEEFFKDYPDYKEDIEDLEDLENYTLVIPIPGEERFIIQNF